MKNKIPVSEVFTSIQGEGMSAGVPSVFLRLGGCNLMCGGQGTQYDKELHNGAQWRCDTIEVWMQAQMKEYQNVFTVKQLSQLASGYHLIITGGEPLMQQKKIVELVSYIKSEIGSQPFIEIETNGTIAPNEHIKKLVNQWNVSPKLSNSGNEKNIRYKPEVIKILSQQKNVQYKYVVASKEDFNEIVNDYITLHGTSKTTLMPAGENEGLLELTREQVAELCIENGIRYTDRMHIVIWNQKTGV